MSRKQYTTSSSYTRLLGILLSRILSKSVVGVAMRAAGKAWNNLNLNLGTTEINCTDRRVCILFFLSNRSHRSPFAQQRKPAFNFKAFGQRRRQQTALDRLCRSNNWQAALCDSSIVSKQSFGSLCSVQGRVFRQPSIPPVAALVTIVTGWLPLLLQDPLSLTAMQLPRRFAPNSRHAFPPEL